MMLEFTDFQKMGIGLVTFGIGFLTLGVLLFFDRGLLAIGNILFISGLAFTIGLERTFWFFCQRHKLKASAFFTAGVIVVLIGYPFFGMCIEIYGFFLLFKGFFPSVISFLRRVPFISFILNLPIINKVVDSLAGDSHRLAV